MTTQGLQDMPDRTTDHSTPHIADRLVDAVADHRAPVCVGIDPVMSRLPAVLRDGEPTDCIRRFAIGVIDAVADAVPVVKVQSACFERYGAAGIETLAAVMDHATTRGVVVILDAKRGDIGISASHYAAAAFEGSPAADWLTVNGYLGDDSLTPFVRADHGIFVLVRTSNPGGDQVQSARLEDGRTVAQAMADLVASVGSSSIGTSGLSSVGAVVGATKPGELAELRDRMPSQVLLLPGFGAQGGTVDDILPAFRADGRGAIVTASRSVIYAFDAEATDWAASVRAAGVELATTVGRAAGLQ